MAFKRVGDIMILLDKYPHLPHWFTIRQALADIEGAQYEVGAGQISSPRTALVFDEAYRLLGQIRRRDILRGMGPCPIAKKDLHIKDQDISMRPDPDLWELSYDKTLETLLEQSEQKVSELMQPIVVTLEFDDPLMKAVSVFIEHDLALIPVLRDGQVVGVVNTVCVCHELAKIIL
jgi:CBS-domain-containing membrane protein